MKPCPECGSDRQYRYKKPLSAQGGYGPDMLPRLGANMFSPAKFVPVVCAECGFMRFFATKEALIRLESSEHWTQV
jgi:RNase P subunit RPR2